MSPLSTNPNLGQVVIFENVQFPFEPCLWPQLEVVVNDSGFLFGFGGCEWCYTTINLIPFSNFLNADDIKFSMFQLTKNQKKLDVTQKQLNTQA